MPSEYQAGVCNIGEDEINYRRRVVGYGSAIVSTALYCMLVFFNVPIILYVSLIIPVFISVHGFSEASRAFCTGYGRSGRYNMSSEVGVTQDVLSQLKRNKDKSYANQLLVKSARVSFLITAAAIGLSRLIN